MSAAWPPGSPPGAAPDVLRPVPPAVLDAAIGWQLRRGEGPLTSAEERAWSGWLAAHRDHARAWRQLGEIDQQLGAVAGPVTRAALLRRTRQPVRTAVVVLAVAVICGALVLNRFQPVGDLLADHRTGTGERRTLVLPDRTVLHLNTRSAVDVVFGQELREVRLRAGEISVETAHGDAAEQRPFVVVTEDGSLRALGTRFVVRRRVEDEGGTGGPTATDLIVTQSAVAARPVSCSATPAAPCAAERIVPAGQGVRLQGGQIAPLASEPDADAWKDGMLVVDDQPLADVVATLARYRPGHLGVAPEVAGLRVTGTLPLADTDQALLALTAAVPVEVAYTTRWWVTLQPRTARAAPAP